MLHFLILASTMGDISQTLMSGAEIVTSIVGLFAMLANLFSPGSKVGSVVHTIGANGPAIKNAVITAANLAKVLGQLEDALKEELAKEHPDQVKAGFLQMQINGLKGGV